MFTDDAVIQVTLDTKEAEKNAKALEKEMDSLGKSLDQLDTRAARQGVAFLERRNNITGKLETYWSFNRDAIERGALAGAVKGGASGGVLGAVSGAFRGSGIPGALKQWAGSEGMAGAAGLIGGAYAAAQAVESLTPIVTGIIDGILKAQGESSPLFKQWIAPIAEGLSAKISEMNAKFASIMPAISDATANAKAELRLGGTLTPSRQLEYFEKMREFHEANQRIRRAHEKSADRELARNFGMMMMKAAGLGR